MREISYHELVLNPIEVFRDDWMLVSAGRAETGINTMTIGWGHIGSLWGKPCAVAYVRLERYTKEFMDREKRFTLSWFGKDYRRELLDLDRKSGRDGDKIAEAGLTPIVQDDAVWFEQARLVVVCRKLYAAAFQEEGFYDKNLMAQNYPDKQFHTAYFGEIEKMLVKD